MDVRTGRHVVFCLHAHLVFTTKRRGKVLTPAHLERLRDIFESVCADFEVELREFNGERDHVHLLVNYPPKVRLSELVNSLKGVSSRLLKKEFPKSCRSGRFVKVGAFSGRQATSPGRWVAHRCRSLNNISRAKVAADAASVPSSSP